MKQLFKNLIIFGLMGMTVFGQSQEDSLLIKLKNSREKDKAVILNQLSGVLLLSDAVRSLEYAQEALSYAEKFHQNRDQVEAYNRMGKCFASLSRFEEALKAFETVLRLTEKNSRQAVRANAFNGMAKVHWQMGNYAQSLKAAEEALTLNLEMENRNGIAQSYNRIGVVQEHMGNYQEALSYYLKELEIVKAEDNKIGLARVLNNIGNIYDSFGDYDIALEYYIESLKIEELLNNREGIAISITNIGNIHLNMENYSKALEYSELALKMDRENGSRQGEAIDLINIGIIYRNQGDAEKAIDFFKDALSIFNEIGDKTGMAYALNSAGKGYIVLEKYQEGLENCLQSLNIMKNLGDKNGIAKSYIDIASLYLKLGKPSKAHPYLVQGLDLATKIQERKLISEGLFLLAEYFAAAGDFQSAFQRHKRYISLKDSLFNEESARQIAEVQALYELDKNQKEIEILRKDKALREMESRKQKFIRNIFLAGAVLFFIMSYIIYRRYRSELMMKVELKKVNERQKKYVQELKELNATKDKFFSIIAHDLKSAFQVQLSGSKLLSERFDQLGEEKIKLIASELKQNTANLFDLLENLLQWSRIQVGALEKQPATFRLKDVLKECGEILASQAAEKNIHLECEVDEQVCLYADRHMICSTVQNLVSNAIKFTPRGGTVKVVSKKENGFIQMTITDTGVGIQKAQLEKLFRIDQHVTTRGTENEKGTGLGLILCKEFIEMNGGQLRIESKIEQGTSVTFTLPSADCELNG